MTKILNYSLLSLFLWDLYLKVNCKSINLKQSNIPKFSDNSRKRNHYPMCSLEFEAAYAVKCLPIVEGILARQQDKLSYSDLL